MIHKKAGGRGLHFLAHLLHCLAFCLSAGIRSQTAPGKNIEAAIFAEIRFQRVSDWCLIRQLADARLAERQRHMSDRSPDEHGDSSEDSGDKDAHCHNLLLFESWFSAHRMAGRRLKWKEDCGR